MRNSLPSDGTPAAVRPRRLAASGLAAMAAAAAMVAGTLLACNQNGPPGTGDRSATPASPTARPSERILQPAPNILVRRSYAPGEDIAGRGIFFMDPGTGEVDAWVTSEDLTPTFLSEDGRYVTFGTYGETVLLDRSDGRASTWSWDSYRLAGANGTRLLFSELASAKSSGGPGEPNGSFLVTDPDGIVSATFTIPGIRYDPVLFHASGRWAALFAVDTLYRADLQTGDVTPMLTIPLTPGGLTIGLIRVEPIGGGDEVHLSVLYRDVEAKLPEFEGTWRLRWDGTAVATLTAAANWPPASSYFSPDGKYVVWEENLRVPKLIDYGTLDSWATLIVADATTLEPVFRVRSAAVSYGDHLADSRWLADSSGFVALVRGDPFEDPFRGQRYAIIGVDSSLQPLPAPPVDAAAWFLEPRNLGPVPSPDDPDLIAFGRAATFRRSTAQWQVLRTGPDGPVHLASWAGGRLVFGQPHGGHGGWGPPVLLDAKVERPPLSDDMSFVVVRTGNCLTIHAAPGLSGPAQTCVPDGSQLVLEEQDDPAIEDAATAALHDGKWWVHVRAADGVVGWADASYLDWK